LVSVSAVELVWALRSVLGWASGLVPVWVVRPVLLWAARRASVVAWALGSGPVWALAPALASVARRVWVVRPDSALAPALAAARHSPARLALVVKPVLEVASVWVLPLVCVAV
jgi:hypothetical protein